MPGPGGGSNSGGFGGGIYEGSNGDSYLIPKFDFEILIDIYVEIQNVCSKIWISLNKPFYTFLEDLMIGDGTGFVSAIFRNIFDALSFVGFDEFLNQFTLLNLVLGSGLLFLIGYGILKWFKS